MDSVEEYGPRVTGSRPGRIIVRCGLEQVIFTLCLVLFKPRNQAGDYVVPFICVKSKGPSLQTTELAGLHRLTIGKMVTTFTVPSNIF